MHTLPGGDSSTNDDTVSNLQQLITEAKRLSGRSYADYESRAGHVISRQRWQQLGSGERIKEFSETATIRAMAEALEVDATVVLMAMARTLGFTVGSDGLSDLARMLPPSSRNLTVEQRDAIVRLVRAIAPSVGASDDVPDPSPASPRTPRKARKKQEVSDTPKSGPTFGGFGNGPTEDTGEDGAEEAN